MAVARVREFFVLATILAVAHAHGYLKEPLSRSSIFMRPEFGTQPPYFWNHQGVWCGNIQQDLLYSTCGRCGDDPGRSDHNQGGIYDKGVIVATYEAGSLVSMEVEVGTAHYGHFQLELCPQAVETDDCFQKLPIVSASEEVRDGGRVCVPYDNENPGPITVQVWLPVGVRCDRCTIRWTYRTSYAGRSDWEFCDNPNPTQTFRNCADVQIV